MKKCRICKKELAGKGVLLHGYPVHPECKERFIRQQEKRAMREDREDT